MPKEYPLLRVEDLTKTYRGIVKYPWQKAQPFVAVNSASFDLRKGETLGLIGESGCGKTTLAQMIAKLIKPNSGQAFLNGQSYLDLDAYDFRFLRPRIQMVFQDPQQVLNPSLQIGQILEEPLIGFKLIGNAKKRREYIETRLKDVGLAADILERYPHQLSGGQRQRVAILGALLPEPSLLIADEVVSALDLSVQAQILNLLTDLKEQHDLSLLFISHDIHVISWLSDRIMVMYRGHIVEEAETADLILRPLHPYTQKLLTAANFTEKEIADKDSDKISPACPYAFQCPYAAELCREVKPQLKTLDRGHRVACHLFE
ncbi:MAG: ABC transporter ATP-binding protein [Firmicutes bacterium]|jgi:oligopeptide/dipeptide ABC transporter ATP-binding protein|nr:ABC transporter ATP-binding protein [Bacillota bacterium]